MSYQAVTLLLLVGYIHHTGYFITLIVLNMNYFLYVLICVLDREFTTKTTTIVLITVLIS